MAAAEVGQIDCIKVLVTEMGCKKDAQNKVHNYMCQQAAHACTVYAGVVCMYVVHDYLLMVTGC